ncbi:hypothetical protein [Colwellia sp. MB02u-9]|uniref:hypothetical protein n=1 Tax=Colwellia sp. MB02u-9 TaxID=2759823 RepID=UPI0015F53436|nr:hypothetical protein [Colwellia sp. MB02u-9]MBA6296590.1 hypothetical protein [Colwellia sp. MB02u-9]
MIDKAKLGFWELFTYFLIGLLISVFVTVYAIQFDYVSWAKLVKLIKDSGAVGVVFLPILFLVLGLIFEPFSNYSLTLIEKIPFLKRRESRGITALEPFLTKYISDKLLNIQRFRYCKAVVEQNFPNSNVSVFLARFGFYRSLGVLMLVLFPITLTLIDITLCSALTSSIYLLLSLIFIKRAQSFKGHMEYEVFFNFIAYRENLIFKGESSKS